MSAYWECSGRDKSTIWVTEGGGCSGRDKSTIWVAEGGGWGGDG